MITMIDEIYDRSFQRGRDQLNSAILSGAHRLRRAIGNTFQVLNRIEYDAPWTARTNEAWR
jgi:hypothetical protein